MKHTYRDRLNAGLESLGFIRLESKSSKYSTWRHPTQPPIGGTLVFVGHAGALRAGKTSTQSHSICDPAAYNYASERGNSPCNSSGFKRYKEILEAGDAALLLKALEPKPVAIA